MDIQRFLCHQRVIGRAPRTIARRAWSLGHWVEHLQRCGMTLSTATTGDVETFLARFPTAQSRYSIRCDIHQLYRYLRRTLPTLTDPTDGLDPISVPRRSASPIHADDVRRLVDVTTGTDRLIVLLAAHAGLRVSEIARVRGEDADLARRWLTVTGKGGHRDVVPISATLADELAGHPRHGRLVAHRNGQAVAARIRRLFRRYGIVGRPHDLRHSFGTEAAAVCNGNVVKVQQLMRHAEVATTMRYVRPSGDLHPVVDHLYDEAA